VSDAEGRRALKRLQEVGVHVLAPAAELAAKPLPGGVAVMTLAEALAAGTTICCEFNSPAAQTWLHVCLV
jgi:hypothetical protein